MASDEQVQTLATELGALVGADGAAELLPGMDADRFLDDTGGVDRERVARWARARHGLASDAAGAGPRSGTPRPSPGTTARPRRHGGSGRPRLPSRTRSPLEAVRRFGTPEARASVRRSTPSPKRRAFGKGAVSEAARRFPAEDPAGGAA